MEKWERRDNKKDKQKEMKKSGKSIRLLQSIIVERSKEGKNE